MTSVVLLYPGQAQSAYRHPVLHLVQGIAWPMLIVCVHVNSDVCESGGRDFGPHAVS